MKKRTIYNSIFSKFICYSICYFTLTLNGYAQHNDTSLHQLQEVIIVHNKQELFQSSKKQITFDSLILSKHNTISLAELLSQQSSIHIKSYGGGNIATTSMRGGNANHTALLWNGLNIQNVMLGQTDLSLIPTSFFNSISLEYGGGSALWGSGAIGGSIHLQNNLKFNQGLKTTLQSSIGSFETKKITASVLLSYKKIISQTKLYYNQSENNYTYKDTLDKERSTKKISHANYSAKGIIQEIAFNINQYQHLNIRLWFNSVNRNLPSYTNAISKQNQTDDNLKLSTDWNYHKKNLKSITRLAFFNDQLNYTDSNAYIFSRATTKTIIVESDNVYTYKNHTFNFGVNFTHYNINTNNYKKLNTLNKLAVFGAYKINLLNHKLNYNLAVRQEKSNDIQLPLTGNSGIQYQLTKLVSTKINGNKSYRQPTLNDLYWNPGGNTLLKPEESYELDGGLELKYQKNNFSLFIEGSYFNRHTTNWIIWLPTENNYWSPKNIAQVYSRGTETKTEVSYSKKNILLKLSINTAYVLSTNQKNNNENDNSINRQLIYTPRYTGQASFLMSYKNIFILLNNSYTGYRFTSTDNASWMDPYNIANFKCSYSHSFKSINLELFGNINNLFDKNYIVISNRPMPLRNYEIGININYYKQKNNNK